jgi:hypothetical protein
MIQPDYRNYKYMTTTTTLNCHWCGVDLTKATRLTYLNGNLPCCDLCLGRGNEKEKDSSIIGSVRT